jgi:hypothetical protein
MQYKLLKDTVWCPSGDGVTEEEILAGIYDEKDLSDTFIDLHANQTRPPVLVPVVDRKAKDEDAESDQDESDFDTKMEELYENKAAKTAKKKGKKKK